MNGADIVPMNGTEIVPVNGAEIVPTKCQALILYRIWHGCVLADYILFSMLFAVLG